MSYVQITPPERSTIAVLRQQGYRPTAIARALGRHRRTIGRELRRNRTARDGACRPQVADWYARGRRRRSRRNTQVTTADQAAGGSLDPHLRGTRKQRRKRYGSYDSRGPLARHLNRRPRKRLGYRTPEECYVP